MTWRKLPYLYILKADIGVTTNSHVSMVDQEIKSPLSTNADKFREAFLLHLTHNSIVIHLFRANLSLVLETSEE